MSNACYIPMPTSYARSRRRLGGSNEEAKPCDTQCLFCNHLNTCQGLIFFFFQSRECFQKILEINPQLQTQVKGETVPADVLRLNSAFPYAPVQAAFVPSPHSATKPQPRHAHTTKSSMLAGCRATLPLFSNSSLCPSFFLHSPPYIFIGNNVLEATRWFKVLGLNCTLVLELSLLKTSLKVFNVLYLSMSPPLKRLLFGNVDVRVLFCFVFCFSSWFARLLASSRSSGES